MNPDTRNMIAAASLSMLVLVGWQLFFVEPELESQRDAYNAAQQANDLPSASPEATNTTNAVSSASSAFGTRQRQSHALLMMLSALPLAHRLYRGL